jgi:hypothetical protein
MYGHITAHSQQTTNFLLGWHKLRTKELKNKDAPYIKLFSNEMASNPIIFLNVL